MLRLEQAHALQQETVLRVLHTGSERSVHARGRKASKLRMSVLLPQIVRFLVIHLQEVFEVLLSVSSKLIFKNYSLYCAFLMNLCEFNACNMWGEILSALFPIPLESEKQILEAHCCTCKDFVILLNGPETMFSVSCREEFRKEVRENANLAPAPSC